MATPPRLNTDVLAVVCEFLADVPDVLSMALTCSSVHPVAIKWLIRMRPVYLKSGPSIRFFHVFLFADAAVRAPNLRALHIDLRWPGLPQAQANDCSLLLDILSSCQYLEHLTVAFEEDSFPTIDDPRFLHAITTIPTLRSFSVRSESVDALALIHQFCTPVRMLSIHSDDLAVASPAVLAESLPLVVIQALEKLELDGLVFVFVVDPHNMHVTAGPPVPSVFAIRPYPAVRSLCINKFCGKPLLDHFQHLFPALDGTLDLGWLDTLGQDDAYALLRAENQSSQERVGAPSWKILDRVVCDSAMFYTLGLRCPIRFAMIQCGSVDKYRYAFDALRENPVPCLKLTLYHEPGMLDGLFSPELGETLTHLTLCLLYSNNYPAGHNQGDAVAASRFQWDNVLRLLVSALQPLQKLTHLRVVIGTSVYVHELAAPRPFAPWEDSEYAHSFRPSRFDSEGTATALARAVPSLRNVFLTVGGFLSTLGERGGGSYWKPYERWYTHRGWRVGIPGRVEAPEGERRVFELHEEVVDTIVRKEELVLSEEDEMELHLQYGWHISPPPLCV